MMYEREKNGTFLIHEDSFCVINWNGTRKYLIEYVNRI